MAEESSATVGTPAPAAAAPVESSASAPAPAAASASAPTPAAPDASASATPAATPTPAAAPAPSAPAVPEKYEFVAPEGMQLDPAVSKEFGDIARELGLSQDAAQKVISKMTPLLAQNDTARDRARIEAAVGRAKEAWVTEAKADKEYGGEHFDANIALARQTFAQFGTPELKALLESSGLDSHPEMIRWAFHVGKLISPDSKVVNGNNTQASAQTFEEKASDKLWGAKK